MTMRDRLQLGLAILSIVMFLTAVVGVFTHASWFAVPLIVANAAILGSGYLNVLAMRDLMK